MIDQTYIQAGHTETLPVQLRELARHPNSAIRRRVAENHNTPLAALINLAGDPDPDVRVALVCQPILPIDILIQLARDECVDVRYELAEMTELPVTILGYLAHDDNPYVSFRAKRTLEARYQHLATTRQAREWIPLGRRGQSEGDKISAPPTTSTPVGDSHLKWLRERKRHTEVPWDPGDALDHSGPYH